MKIPNILESCGLALVAVMMLAGCISNPNAETWRLPQKDNSKSAMIVGRVDVPHNKAENPKGDKLYLQAVNFMLKDKIYWMDGSGEKNYVLDNNYFVVPNIKPGKYYFRGFLTVHGFNSISDGSSDKDMFEVKPGEIKFIGSFDYVKNDRSVMEKIKNTGTFTLRRASHPTEQEMFQWLKRVGAGSGWESSINKHIQ